MSPHIKGEDRPFGIWWRRWAGTIALVALIVVGVAGFQQVEDASTTATDAAKEAKSLAKEARHEGKTREKQFCGLVLGNYFDRKKRVTQTHTYLHSSLGRESTGLNNYVRRISLPQSELEVKKERKAIPDLCWKYAPDSPS
jgi:hypothetical protein